MEAWPRSWDAPLCQPWTRAADTSSDVRSFSFPMENDKISLINPKGHDCIVSSYTALKLLTMSMIQKWEDPLNITATRALGDVGMFLHAASPF